MCSLDKNSVGLNLGDKNRILSELFSVCCCDTVESEEHFFNLIISTLKIKNLGLLSLAFPETFAIYESAVLKMGHDFSSDEIVHHVISDCPVVGDVSAHC